MAKCEKSINWRVEVVASGGWRRAPGRTDTEQLAAQIKRHCDDVTSVTVECDTLAVCEYCGYPWSEDSPTYNGGCCAKDEANAPA